jgi:RNA polymerase sigma-70 factor, ECF subfamily
LLERFLATAEEGDLEALEELLAKDAVLYADGGGKAIAPPEPLFGAALVARLMAGVTRMRRAFGEFETRLVRVNGQPGRLCEYRACGSGRSSRWTSSRAASRPCAS